MAQWQRLSTIDQFTAHLRSEILSGRWTGVMPGVHRLASECGLNRKTVEAALQRLEQEGRLEGQGPGKRRRIVLPKGHTPTGLRVAILLYEPLELTEGWIVQMQHLLLEAGCRAFFLEKSLMELQMDVRKVARMVRKTEADAWVVCAGSRDVLEWITEQGKPVFALFGRQQGLRIAGTKPDKATALNVATNHLISLGHRRIVLLTRPERRVPEPGRAERSFLEQLEMSGIQISSYNLPDWEGTAEGFQQCLVSLFEKTPPTALILSEPPMFFAAQQLLGNMGLRVPEDVSLVCTDDDWSFEWCRPTVAYIRWDYRLVRRRVVRWANNVAHGKEDRRQSFTKAEFVAGGTVGALKV